MQLGFVKKTFRDTLMFSKSVCNRSMRFPVKGNENKEEQANFFEEIQKRMENNAIEEEDEDNNAL